MSQRSKAQLNPQQPGIINGDMAAVFFSTNTRSPSDRILRVFPFSYFFFVMADKMAQWVNMSAAKPESLSSNPRTHMVRENWFT